MEGGKWGLVIIFSAFMIQFLTFGATGAIGVYNIELLDYFHGATVQVSLIGSINYGIFLGTGPIISFLMTKFSYRQITLFGSALVVLGILGMPLLPYIPAMCICFGVLTGFGSCCTYIPSHVLSGLYYDKYRSLATGVTTSGSGLGGAVMPVLCGLLIEHYSWKGSLIFVAGLCLHLFILCALLRSPPSSPTKRNADVKDKPCSSEETQNQLNINDQLENEALLLNNVNNVDICQTDGSISAGDSSHANINVKAHKLVHSTIFKDGNGSVDDAESSGKNVHENQKLISKKSGTLPGSTKHHSLSLNSLHAVGTTRGSGQLVLDDNTDICSNKQLAENKMPEEGENKKLPKASRHIFIFTNYGFDIYFLSNIMWNAGAAIVSAFAPEFLTERGLTSMEAAWLSGAFGLGVFVGGILGGLLGNFAWVNRQLLYTLANLSMGVILIVFPYFENIALYTTCLVTSGIAFGVILGLLIIVLTDLIGIESLGNGLGYLMLSNGLGTFIGPPMAGAIREISEGFEEAIILAGALCVLGGVIMFLMPLKRVCCKTNDSMLANVKVLATAKFIN